MPLAVLALFVVPVISFALLIAYADMSIANNPDASTAGYLLAGAGVVWWVSLIYVAWYLDVRRSNKSRR
jgi:hypothetical protein